MPANRKRLVLTVLLCVIGPAGGAAVPSQAGAQRVVDRPALRTLAAATPAPRRLLRPTWLARVTITEYYPAPERWFRGRRVAVPGLAGKHRIDWLFSARGVTMEGDGIGLDGNRYHVVDVGRGGWVDVLGRPAPIGGLRPVFWRAGAYWRNARAQLTYPLDGGGWSNGAGVRYVPLLGSSFARGMSLPLRPYHSLAVDPRLIPLGSRVYIPAYHGLGGGWFTAQDTGGAIGGAHVDVYRTPPGSPEEGGRYLSNQRILVVPPGQRAPASRPSAKGGAGEGGDARRGAGEGGATNRGPREGGGATGGSGPR